jgi:hypothetical protein
LKAPGSSYSGKPTNNENLSHGLVETVTPVAVDGSDGKGFLREYHSGGGGTKGWWNIGSTADNNGAFETVFVDGYDPSYTLDGLRYLCRCALISGDDDQWRTANLMRNQLYSPTGTGVTSTGVNTTTFQVDGSNGSRHATNFQLTHPIDQILTFGAGTVGLSTTTMAALWNQIGVQSRSNARNGAESFYRDTAYNVGDLLMSMTAWPAH